MRQVTYRPKDGDVSIADVPVPRLRPGWVLVANHHSVISAGTERNKIATGEKNLLQKARARPDLTRKVLDKARVDGVGRAISVARDRLAALTPIGYSSAGIVQAVGAGVEGLTIGDRVACGGAGWANHAEMVVVPKNLVARIPDEVELADAAYATIGAIALHGIRQSGSTVGDRVGVIGLGLVGQLAMQILAAIGCKPIGVDVDLIAVNLASDTGGLAFRRTEPALEEKLLSASGGPGLDAVLICASTDSDDPVKLATRLARGRGRIVVIGNVPISVEWDEVYAKELEFRLSRSYGPGRYDRNYEERGWDLPAEYVRWTEQRNMVAFLELVAGGRVSPSRVTTHRFPLEQASAAYAVVSGKADAARPFGVVLDYTAGKASEGSPRESSLRRKTDQIRLGLIGAGAFARATLIPALPEGRVQRVVVASDTGLSAADVVARLGFERSAASAEEVIGDETLDAIMIATRHATHAALAAAALRAGKAVFVEKPLALTLDEVDELEAALRSGSMLMVGFNRRFAPFTQRLASEFSGVPERMVGARVNAGPLADDHWMHDWQEGGRLLGEGCHFVDLINYLLGSSPTRIFAFASPQRQRSLECSDSVVATFEFADGSVATLNYSGAGDTRLPKERIEIFGGGMSAVVDDFRRLDLYRRGKRETQRGRQDKGHRAQIERFVEAAAGRAEPPPADSYLLSTRATIALVASMQSGQPVSLA
jgi:predicted dehydrogenase/threonine dehydrogenase-like Zn-dependent dehydrogenase